MFVVYALYSEKFKKIYIGYSSAFESRLDSHNLYAKKGYTVRYRPWLVIHTEEFQNKVDAIRREKALKSAKGRAFIWTRVREKYG